MELELSRVDYTLVGVNAANCMRVVPEFEPNEPKKIAVADEEGIVQIFTIRKKDVQLHFKSLPGNRISCLRLGGASGTLDDKIFVASGNEVRGFTKKGKLFLSFDSNLTEAITAMYVHGSDLFLCGRHIYNHYRDCKDMGSYLCGDCIVDVIAFQAKKTRRVISLIACEGRMIRALEHSRVTLSMEVESSPTILHNFTNGKDRAILFGTVDGKVGILDVENSQSFKHWLVDSAKSNSSITCIDSYDFTGNENKELVIGRNDGNIEIYSVNLNDKLDRPVLLFNMNCNESVTSIQSGNISSALYHEILVSTYTGRVFGLTAEPLDSTAGGDSVAGSYVYSADTSQKINKLKNEIEELQAKVSKEREKYQNSTQSFLEEYSAIPLLNIKDTMTLSKEEASYTLTLDVPTAIDNVLLQSNVPVNLLDVEKNSAVVSFSQPEEKNSNYLLATYRCQVNTNRLEVKIRTIEGQYGTLQAYVTPLLQPKCCQLKKYEIKPLSLHYRIHTFDVNRPLNVLTIKGSFTLAEMHSWIFQCLPEVPDKAQLTEKTTLYFKSTFLDTIISCVYSKGEIEVKSDNISPLSILKEYISKEATKKKIKIDISTNIDNESVSHVLKLVHPKLTEHVTLSNQIDLLDALHELEVNDKEAASQLTDKYQKLLEKEKELRMRYSSQPSYLDRLYGIITDLYVDYYKFKGANVKSKIPQLILQLDKYQYENLLDFFMA